MATRTLSRNVNKRDETPRPGYRSAIKLASLAILGVMCVALGGFALPGSKAPPSEIAAAPAPTPVPIPPQAPIVATAPEEPEPEPIPATGPRAIAGAIDRDVRRALAVAQIPVSPLASDAEFLRRVALDLTGRTPTRAETVAFLFSSASGKRAKLIDDLLGRPEFGQHMARVWRDLLVKRDFDNNKNLKTDAFVEWFAAAINEGRGWDRIVSEMVTATGKENEVGSALFFSANQDNNQPSPSKLTGATANLFMGVQLQCAECHVHPHTAGWGVKDFWGMAAFYGHTKLDHEAALKGRPKLGTAMLKETDGKVDTTLRKKDAGKAPLAGAVIAIPDPTDPKKTVGTAQAKYFGGKAPALPTVAPYRKYLADWLVANDNAYFAPAMTNRVWAHFFARGLVNPVEDMNPDNPATHPAVLKLLAEEFRSSGHDIKHLVRCICNSQAYQRTSKPSKDNANDETLLSHMPVKVFSADMLLDSLAIATNASGRPDRRFFDTRDYDDDPTEFSLGIPQVLRLMNTGLTNKSAEVAARVAKEKSDPEIIIAELYLIALSRMPSDDETKRMMAYVAKRGDPAKGYAGVFWALLNSAEFVCNH